MTENLDRVIGRIQLLLDRVDDNSGATKAEREAARGKALHLLAKYNLSEAEVLGTRADENEFIRERVEFGGSYVARIQAELLADICEPLGISTLVQTYPGGCRDKDILMYGRRSSIETVKLLFGPLSLEMANEALKIKARRASEEETFELASRIAFWTYRPEWSNPDGLTRLELFKQGASAHYHFRYYMEEEEWNVDGVPVKPWITTKGGLAAATNAARRACMKTFIRTVVLRLREQQDELDDIYDGSLAPMLLSDYKRSKELWPEKVGTHEWRSKGGRSAAGQARGAAAGKRASLGSASTMPSAPLALNA